MDFWLVNGDGGGQETVFVVAINISIETHKTSQSHTKKTLLSLSHTLVSFVCIRPRKIQNHYWLVVCVRIKLNWVGLVFTMRIKADTCGLHLLTENPSLSLDSSLTKRNDLYYL